MKKLLEGTSAYRTFSNDVQNNRLSHAYMLDFGDAKKLREALKIFALRFFGESADSLDGRRILNGNFPDFAIYPEEDKKPTADGISALIADSALQPLEREKKLYAICGFNEASPLIQNKLLKTLEEPPRGIHFMLGVTTTAPVLSTVKSRVKTLTVAPFAPSEILAALERRGANPLNKQASESCGGILGIAENMTSGGWFEEVAEGALKICSVTRAGEAGEIAVRYGDIKHKAELLAQIRLLFREALAERVRGDTYGKIARLWQTPALIYAEEIADKACADLKFNAFFQGLLYDLMLRIIEENDKWLKLQE